MSGETQTIEFGGFKTNIYIDLQCIDCFQFKLQYQRSFYNQFYTHKLIQCNQYSIIVYTLKHVLYVLYTQIIKYYMYP